MRDTDLREAADLINQAERIVIFTGAGVSAESGIPTFRDALTGLWERFDPRRLATPEAFGDPEPTPLDAVARINLHGPAAEVLPALAAVGAV